jgi:hypothetical protein
MSNTESTQGSVPSQTEEGHFESTFKGNTFSKRSHPTSEEQEGTVDADPPELTLQEVSDNAMAWRKEAFGERPFTAPLHHLQKEVKEAIESDGNIMELADCLLLLLDAFCLRHPTLYATDLLRAAANKVEINKKRKWGKPDEHGAYQHIESKPAESVTDEQDLQEALETIKDIIGLLTYADIFQIAEQALAGRKHSATQ